MGMNCLQCKNIFEEENNNESSEHQEETSKETKIHTFII